MRKKGQGEGVGSMEARESGLKMYCFIPLHHFGRRAGCLAGGRSRVVVVVSEGN